ncbi:DUF1645 domain-containing protein [Melia azedarach]|uniref:DUF1645 domain-containing protein n=1 Tax=Melia azedarach TaxID=155640 RepID=A0ACC1XLP4_MELAZ|nr:DUF1645 domain-containing protein [Melia azedarach]
MQASPLLSLSPNSPSFNSYSSANLAEIAARVVEEFRNDSDFDSDIFHWEQDTQTNLFSSPQQQHKEEKSNNNEGGDDEEEEEDEEEEFEFAVLCRKPDSPISADEIFFNGQIKPIYPLFNRDLLLNEPQYQTNITAENCKPKPRRLPLGKLMSEERETWTASASCSSSEADDLDNLQPGTYCVWTPKASESPGRCKKSNSTGSSKRWKFRDLLYRSNSDGKDTFVFLTTNKKNSSTHHHHKVGEESNKEIKSSAGTGKVKVVEEHFARNRAIKEDDKKRSFLPYKQDLVGFFNNVNGLSRNLHPF